MRRSKKVKKIKKKKVSFSKNVIDIRRALEKELKSNSPSLGYLAMAIARGCKAFLTGDEDILSHEKVLNDLYGITVTSDYALAMSITAYNEAQIIGVPY